MSVSKRLRFEILRRDNHQCRYCGGVAPDVVLTIDHVVPVALGGSDDPENLVTACKDCNAGKSSVPADAQIVSDVSSEAMKWAAAMKQVAEMRAVELESQFALLDWFMSVWNNWTDWRGDPFDADDAPASLPQFMKAGLTKQEMQELVGVAMKSPARDKWRYFCGCCWKRIKQNQELAAQIVAQQSPSTPPLAITTRWTQADLDRLLSLEGAPLRWIGPLLECEDHNDGQCERDTLCQIVSAARTRESLEQHSIRKNHKRRAADKLNDAVDEAENYAYG